MKYFFYSLLFILALTSCTDQDAASEREIKQYLASNDLTAERTPEGIYYIIDVAGNDEYPNVNNTVTCNYTGMLTDGFVFDEGTNSTFGMWNVIDGWKIGLQYFSVGSSGKLFIPSGLAYGPEGTSNIPENAVLIFDIELLDFY